MLYFYIISTSADRTIKYIYFFIFFLTYAIVCCHNIIINLLRDNISKNKTGIDVIADILSIVLGDGVTVLLIRL